MRVWKLSASLVIMSIMTSCGWFKKKGKDDDSDNSADAIAEASDIQWDTEYRLSGELVEDPSGEPFGAPATQGGLTCLAEPGCDVPRAAGDQPERDAVEADPVRDPRSVTAQRVGVDRAWR